LSVATSVRSDFYHLSSISFRKNTEVKYSKRGHLYSASSRTRPRCATASRKSALISPSQLIQPGISTTLRYHGYGLSYHDRDMAVYFPQFRRVLIPACPGGRLRLSRPGSAPRWFTRPKTVTHPGTNRA